MNSASSSNQLETQLQGLCKCRSDAFFLGLLIGFCRCEQELASTLREVDSVGLNSQFLVVCQAIANGGPIAQKVMNRLAGLDSADAIFSKLLAKILSAAADAGERKAGHALALHDRELHDRYLSHASALRKFADSIKS